MGGNGKGKSSRQQMKERFFFYGINMLSDNTSVYQAVNPLAPAHTHPAQTLLLLVQPASMCTKNTLQRIVIR
jgi:hypothetical protein